jgi:hypothetical protein
LAQIIPNFFRVITNQKTDQPQKAVFKQMDGAGTTGQGEAFFGDEGD